MLPPEVLEKFLELGDLQRGRPEYAMLDVQKVMKGGVLSPLVEHVGDITHRMTHLLKYGKGNVGEDMVAPKVKLGLRYLTHPYGFERELMENIERNAEHLGVDPEDLKEKVFAALKKYGDEHSKLPVYNKAQMLARDAAVFIGYGRWSSAITCLRLLQRMLDNDTFAEEAVKYEMNNGEVVQYTKYRSG